MTHQPVAPSELTGSEDEVWFRPGDTFTGVQRDWLIPRLRLAPDASPVDLEHAMVVYLDDDEIVIPDFAGVADLELVLGEGPNDGEVVRFDDGGIVGSSVDLIGGWLHVWSPEVLDELRWIGPVEDLRDLALGLLGELLLDLGFDEDRTLNVSSPYLDVSEAGDSAAVAEATDAGTVIMNDHVLRSS